MLESGRDVSPTGRSFLNQEENIRHLCLKPSKRGGTPHWVEGQTDHERVRWPRRLIVLEQEAR